MIRILWTIRVSYGDKKYKKGIDIQLLPYILGAQNSTLENSSDPDSKFGHRKLDGAIGLSAKYGISSTLTLDATYNPDFSQVEADIKMLTDGILMWKQII